MSDIIPLRLILLFLLVSLVNLFRINNAEYTDKIFHLRNFSNQIKHFNFHFIGKDMTRIFLHWVDFNPDLISLL
jgi:hypothetical protein